MKSVILLLAISCIAFANLRGEPTHATALLDDLKVTSDEFAARINSVQKQWVATHYPQWDNISLGEFVKTRLGSLEEIYGEMPPLADDTVTGDIPDNFDSRTQWPNCVHKIRDQGRCGSCWAFGAAEALSDRFCVATGEKTNLDLATQYIVSCDNVDQGCNGGWVTQVWSFLESSGTVTESCWPYASGGGSAPKCSSFSSCADGSTKKIYYVQKGSSKTYSKPDSIKSDILVNGPMETRFDVYQDFMSYKSGIYRHTSGSRLGGHAIKVLGWGVEGGVKYWICANSWGSSWGETGFFRIELGQCGIDSSAVGGIPDTSRTRELF